MCFVSPHWTLIQDGFHHFESLLNHCSTLSSWCAVVSSLYSAACIFGLFSPSTRLYDRLTNPILLISRAWYACLAEYKSSITRFSLLGLPLAMIPKRLLKSVSICTAMIRPSMNSICLQMASTSSDRSAKAITSADSTDHAIHLDLYELYDSDMALFIASVLSTIRPSCDDR